MSPEPDPIVRKWTPVEIASLLKKEVRTVRGWLNDPNHPLKGVKIMNQWYVDEPELKKFLKGEAA